MSGQSSLNHIYRTVWNEALGAMVAVAEIAVGPGKSSGTSTRGQVNLQALLWAFSNLGILAAGVALAWGAAIPVAMANPVGGVPLVPGTATFATKGNVLTVTTTAPTTAIDWQSFSIPTGSTTYFQQPSISSTAINRVVTNAPSLIFGTLGSNGNVVLVNQSGITVGAGGVVDTAGFTASALRMSDADALSGRLRFGDAASGGGTVSVMGSVLARSGDVVLLGSSVSTGSNALVQAPNGSTVLAAGQQVEITGRGLEGIVMQVQAPSDSAVNLGTLKGDAVGIFAGTLRNSGAIQATTVTNEGGKIFLKAAQTADVGGVLSASGTQGGVVDVSVAHSADPNAPGVVVQTASIDANGSGGAGGQVRIAGDNVLSTASIHVDGSTQGGSLALLATNRTLSTSAAGYSANSVNGKGGDILVSADVSNYTSGSYSAMGKTGGSVTLAGAEIKLAGTQVDASGNQGGGLIHVGGVTHGGAGFSAQGVALANASTVLTNSHASFKADALESGNGGDVVLWSDDTLRFTGAISAKGGSVSGNGGFTEVSGLKSLTYAGTADLTALHGSKGTLLLDPKNITVVAGGGPLTGNGGTTYLELIDPTPGAAEGFGGNGVTVMSNGEVVVPSPLDSVVGTNAGAVYFFDTTGTLNATLLGAAAGDRISSGGITALAIDKLLINSPSFGIGTGTVGKGALTWVDGATGKLSDLSVGGTVSASNSLVGQATGDGVGTNNAYPNYYSGTVNGNATLFASGKLLINTPYFGSGDGVTAVNAKGAVTWMNPSTGLLADGSSGGVIDASNSVVGAAQGDRVGSNGITVLANDKLLINSPNFGIGLSAAAAPKGKGAITWLDGTTGKLSDLSSGGAVSTSNSLVGQATGDVVGSNNNLLVYYSNSNFPSLTNGEAVLSNGNLVIYSALFGSGDGLTAANAKGAVTWMNPATGLLSDGSSGGAIGAANSVLGATQGDRVGSGGIYVNSLSNFAIASPYWGTTNGQLSTAKGAVTPVIGLTGKLSNANTGAIVGSGTDSLVGSTNGDQVGTFALILGQQIGPSQSAMQAVGDNLLVFSDNWTNVSTTSVAAGAVTWINGTTGLLSGGSNLGAITASNSLVGSNPYDRVGTTATWNFGSQSVRPVNGLFSLTGSANFAIRSGYWGGLGTSANVRGAVTWFNGSTGTVGTVSSSNSLVGSHARDLVGTGFTDAFTNDPGLVALPNGNYVVFSSQWNGGTGAVTWVNGSNGKQADGASGGGVGGEVSGTTGPLQALSTVGVAPVSFLGAKGLVLQANGGSNFVIKSPWVDLHGQDSGAATWVNGATGQLSNGAYGGVVSDFNSLTGAIQYDNAGGDVYALSNGNFIAKTPVWGSNAISSPGYGAVSWINGSTGVLSNGATGGQINGSITGNSLVGSTIGDMSALVIQQLGASSNNNVLLENSAWHNGTNANAGAITWMDASSGKLAGGVNTGGAIGVGNSLLGSLAGDNVGSTTYSPVSELNSKNHLNGSGLLVTNSNWSTDKGAVTWMDGKSGLLAGGLAPNYVSSTNSLVGDTGSHVGSGTIFDLGNGNFLISSPNWSGVANAMPNAGAVTWINGQNGQLSNGSFSGLVAASNSLVGGSPGDQIGSGVEFPIVLLSGTTFHNALVFSPNWSNTSSAQLAAGTQAAAGAVTWINGANGTLSDGTSTGGVVSSSNSLVGEVTNSRVGNSGITQLGNGKLVISSNNWGGSLASPMAGAGAVTWMNGSNGQLMDNTSSGVVSSTNSLVGSDAGDGVGYVYSFSAYGYGNSNYLVPTHNLSGGALTWVNGSSGQTANGSNTVSTSNSLMGSNPSDNVDQSQFQHLDYGDKLAIVNTSWNSNAGSVTWMDPTTGQLGNHLYGGAVGAENSLIGQQPNDSVGSGGVVEFSNGKVVVLSPNWANGQSGYAGAVTLFDGVTGSGTSGAVSPLNSLVGSSPFDEVGNGGTIELTNGFLVRSPIWNSYAGAVTYLDYAAPTVGPVSGTNSLVGNIGDQVGIYVDTLYSSGNVLIRSPYWGSGSGAVTWMNGTDGTLSDGTSAGVVGTANSLVGTNSSDAVGNLGYVELMGNGNLVIGSGDWANNNRFGNGLGAVTWMNGNTGKLADGSSGGEVSAFNSLIGSTAGDMVGASCFDCTATLAVTALSDGNYVVNSPLFATTGAITWADGSKGLVGTLDSSNSALVRVNSILFESLNLPGKVVVGSASAKGGYGGVYVIGAAGTGGLVGPSYTDAPNADATIGADTIAAALATADVTLQANNDITVNADITVTFNQAPSSLILQAGRSINVNANITAKDGNLTLVANDNNQNVDASNSVPGTANLKLGANTTLDVGNGRVSLQLLNGAGNPNVAIGTITQDQTSAILANNLDVVTHGGASLVGLNQVNVLQLTNTGSAASVFNNVGTNLLTVGDYVNSLGVTGDAGSVSIATAGDLQGYGGQISSSSAGDAIILAAGGNFYDGGVSLTTPNGRWLVYSTDPGLNNAAANTLVKGDFKQYAAPIGTAPAQSTGNGFLYSITPTLTGSVNGLITKAYDSTTQIALNSSNFIVSNSLNNSDLISVAPMTGNFNSKNVGVATTVSATGLTVASATDGQIAVYGYQFPVNATATGSGFITPATVTLTAPVVSKTYDGTTNYVATVANLNAMGSALFTGDSVSAATLSYADKNVGISNKTVDISAATLNDGNGGANYQVTFAGNTTSTINQAPLTVSTSNVTKTYNASTNMIGATGQGAVVVGGTLFTGDSLSGGSFAFTDKNAGSGNKAVTVAGVTVTDANNNANNYNVSYQNNTTSTINQAPLTVSTSNVTKTYNASTDMTGATGQGAVVVGGTLFSGDSLTGGSFAFTDKNAGIGNKAVTVAGVTVTDANNNANNYNVSYQNNTTSTINKALVTVTAPSVSKTYDGTTTYATTPADLSAMSTALAGTDTFAGATLTFADKNAGTGNKVVSLSAITINDGNGGANYTLTANGNTTSTINPLTQVTWTNSAGGLWSNQNNWSSGIVPDGANVLAVSVLNGAAVTYDLTTPTTVQAINMTGSFTMATGSLAVTGNLNTPQYTQTGGTLTGTGGLTVTGNFSQSAGSIAMAGPVSITQSSGNLSAGSISGSSINLAATSGAISQSSALTTTGLLKASASNGITLTNAANAASAFSATTTGPGNIALTNAAPLDVQGITAASGNVVINNTGAISNTGAINVSGGTVDIISHSPITIGNAVNASGNITLAALTPDNTSNITLNGSMTSTAGGISIQAYNNFIQNSNLSAALAIDVSTVAGSLTFGPGAYSVGNPVTYTVNGAPYLPPWIASTLSGGATDFVVAFLDQFQAVLDAQQVTPIDDPLGLIQSSNEGIVVEGEICRP